jgi:hypothetical protein
MGHAGRFCLSSCLGSVLRRFILEGKDVREWLSRRASADLSIFSRRAAGRDWLHPAMENPHPRHPAKWRGAVRCIFPGTNCFGASCLRNARAHQRALVGSVLSISQNYTPKKRQAFGLPFFEIILCSRA